MTRDPDFERALAESPADAGTRLVYADWLDDHGEAAYAAAHRWLAARHLAPARWESLWLFGGPMNGGGDPLYDNCKLPGRAHEALKAEVVRDMPGDLGRSPLFVPTASQAMMLAVGGLAYTMANWCVFRSHRQSIEYLARALGDPA